MPSHAAQALLRRTNMQRSGETACGSRRWAARFARLTLCFALLLLAAHGCGSTEPVAKPPPARKSPAKPARATRPTPRPPIVAQNAQPAAAAKRDPAAPSGHTPRPTRTFADLLTEPDDADRLAESPIDESAAAAAGLRRLAGKHLTLYTDVPSSPAVDELPQVFDAAIDQWAAYFKLDAGKLADWKPRAALIKDKEKGKAAGLLTAGMPPFLHGYARAKMLWLYEQPTDYYRRHLLLHEGTHALMYHVFGRAGPPWYSEGMAELLATHHWQNGRLTLAYFPNDREEVANLGRIKIVRDEFAAHRALTLPEVLAFDGTAHLKTEAYAWSWALAALLDRHPRYCDRFGKLLAEVEKDPSSFNIALRQLYDPDLPALMEEWQVYVAGLEHSYDFERTQIDFMPGEPLAEPSKSITVHADRGWQNTGIQLAGNGKYELTASGRFQLADKPRIWWSEPGGVSIRYYQGRPLGVLLAAVRPDGNLDAGQPSAFLSPTTIGLGTTLSPGVAGTLFLKINDSAGELGDNKGSLTVTLKRL